MYCKLLAPPVRLSPFHSLISGRVCSPVGPAVEAFGFERIVYGSAPSLISHARSNAGDWYEIAREAFAELGVDQESVDAVFGGNAQRIYVASSGHS
jgi:predicted TIM-barrel fold metal-dependent hydrolase